MSVVNVKRGTQTFSTAEQTSSMKTDRQTQVNGAEDFAKAFGDQHMGEILNKVADPNWVDPSKKMRTAGDPNLDKDAFLKLMLAQMKNQDPTNPLQSHEMASQLAQFTSLEQLSNINTTLEGMKNAQAPNANYQALGFIGKKVSGDSSKLTRSAGDTKHNFNFTLMNDAMKAKVTVKDAAGQVVRAIEYPNGMKKGENSIEWNGLNDQGLPARAGEYRFAIEAQASNGAKVYAKTSFEGRITGLSYGNEGPVLMVGDQTIKMGDVKKIEDVSDANGTNAIPLRARPEMAALIQQAQQATKMKPQAQAIDVAKSPSMAKIEASKANEVPAAEEAEVQPVGNIQDVPMSREMLTRLERETK